MFDIGSFVQEVGDKVANMKGYTDLTDLAKASAAKNLVRITDKPNEVKQTTPTQDPGPWSLEVLSQQKVAGLTGTQLIIVAGLGAAVLFLALRRR